MLVKEDDMIASVDTKSKKKQPPLLDTLSDIETSKEFEQSLLMLEDLCLEIKEGQFTHGKADEDRIFWQLKLKNIVTPLSLALNEYKGPRTFHHHYRHSEHDANVMEPVLESPLGMLLKVCDKALHCLEDTVGMKGSLLLEKRNGLERALRKVLASGS